MKRAELDAETLNQLIAALHRFGHFNDVKPSELVYLFGVYVRLLISFGVEQFQYDAAELERLYLREFELGLGASINFDGLTAGEK